MLHPDFPVVSGPYRITREWSVFLPGEFNKRMEDEDLVIWRPGFTLWIAVWGDDRGSGAADTLAWIREDISVDATDLLEEGAPGLLRLRYRLDEDADDAGDAEGDERVAAYYGFAVSDRSHVQMAMYFDHASGDDASGAAIADAIWRSVSTS